MVGYTTCVAENADVRLTREKVEYAMMPVWVLHTKWKGKDYLFSMNGQTGKFVGDLPVDKRAAVLKTIGNTLLFGLGAAAIALLIALL